MLSEKYHILVEEEDNKHRYLIMFEFALFDHFEGVHMEVLEMSPYFLMLIGSFITQTEFIILD